MFDELHRLSFCKQLIFASIFSLLSLQAIAENAHQGTRTADQIINQLYLKLNSMPKLDMPARIAYISAQFLGKPYVLGALGEGPQGDYDRSPLYRTDAFDCETFVDTVLALALAHNIHQFKQRIDQVRYHDGQVLFTQRNHFTCLDWNQNNQRQGFVTDITTSLKDKQQRSVAKFASALIDKPAWYQHMTNGTIRINHLNEKERALRLSSLKQEGSKLPRATSVIPYIPLDALFDAEGEANQYLFNQIPDAAIIEIIRPNWDLSKQIGTHMNVSHLGFAIWKNKVLFFREASSIYNRVVDEPLIEYLREARKSPTIKGINIQVVSK